MLRSGEAGELDMVRRLVVTKGETAAGTLKEKAKRMV